MRLAPVQHYVFGHAAALIRDSVQYADGEIASLHSRTRQRWVGSCFSRDRNLAEPVPGYEIVIDDPEFTSVCPKTGLPDFGKIEIRYVPDRLCLELKSLKEYLQSYRNLGIFQENIVNQVLNDVVRWAKPVWAEVKGDFRPRGGISTVVVARWPRAKGRQK